MTTIIRIAKRIGAIPLLIVFLATVIQVNNANFLSQQNLMNIMRQISINSIIAFGMTFVIIVGGIDLSIGSIIGFSSVVGCVIMRDSGSLGLGISCALTLGAVCGLLNGLVIVYTRLHPFIVTLSSLSIFRGLAFIYTNGELISGMPLSLLRINSGSVGFLPFMIIIAAAVFCILSFLLNHTRFGRHIYAIGGREEAAVAAGIRVKQVKVAVYALSGLLAALAGIMLTSRIVLGQASAGANYHLTAIGMTVIGGTSLRGGRGTLGGTVLGVIVIGILSNGLNLLRVSSFWQDVAMGATIVVAVLADSLHNRKAGGAVE